MSDTRIFADFHNADSQGRLRLNCVGTSDDLRRQDVKLHKGQSLILYSEELQVEGVVQYSEEEKLWVAAIDWNITRESGKIAAPFGSAKGLIKMLDDFNEPLEDFEEYAP
jgi:hypothetical protein